MRQETNLELDGQRWLLHLVLLAAIGQVVLGGVRFVDGSALIKFADYGFNAHLKSFSQYLFDSPLKIALLYLLHLRSAVSVGIVFLALNALPALAIFVAGRSPTERIYLLAIFGVLPTWKIMFENVGVGDSVVFACSIMLIFSNPFWVVVSAATLLVLWHFQQGVLICAIVICLLASSGRLSERARAAAVFEGLLLGGLVFALANRFLLPDHSGRVQFILSYMAPFLARNILYLPLAVACAVPGVLFVFQVIRQEAQAPSRVSITLACLMLTAAVIVAILTTDVSRVLVLLTFPIILILTNPRNCGLAVHRRIFDPHGALSLLLLPVFVPIFSWSGVDYYLWPTLLHTFQKYGFTLPGFHW